MMTSGDSGIRIGGNFLHIGEMLWQLLQPGARLLNHGDWLPHVR
jgi:hypothetical protein